LVPVLSCKYKSFVLIVIAVSKQSRSTMLFFWSYFPLSITIFLFLKKKQEGFSFLSGLKTSLISDFSLF
jgi:hypothetical protein